LPSELLDFTGELVIWLILGMLLLAQFSELGLETFHVSSRGALAVIARHITATINIVGSRRVEIRLDLPMMNIVGVYKVVVSGRMVLVESNRDSVSCLSLYPCISKTLESSHHYLVRFSEGRIFFEEA